MAQVAPGDAPAVRPADKADAAPPTAPPGGEPPAGNKYMPPSRRGGGDGAAVPDPSSKRGPAPYPEEDRRGGGGFQQQGPPRGGYDQRPGSGYDDRSRAPGADGRFGGGGQRDGQRFGGGGRFDGPPPREGGFGGGGRFDGPPPREGGFGGGGRFDGPPPREGGFGGRADGPPRDGQRFGGGFRDGPPPREGGFGGGFRDGPPRDGGFGGGFRDGPPREGGGFRDGPPRESGFGGGFREGPPREGGGRFGGGPPPDAQLPAGERREFPGGPSAGSGAPEPPVEVDHERFRGLAPSAGDAGAYRRPDGGAFGGPGERAPLPAAFQGYGGGGRFPDGGPSERAPLPAAFQSGRREGGGFLGGGSGDARGEMPAAFSMMGSRRDREGEGGGPPGGGYEGGRFGGGRQAMPDAFARMGQQGGDRREGGGGMGMRSYGSSAAPPPPSIGGQKELSEYIGKPEAKKSANAHADKPAPAAAEAAPAVDDSVTKAAALGLEVARATMSKRLLAALDTFMTDTSKNREKNALAAVTALRTPELSGDIARIVVDLALGQAKSGDRKQLALLINALRTVKPLPLISDGEVGACLSAATARADAASGGSEESVARLRHLVEELSKAPKNAFALAAMPADVQAFVAAAAAAADAARRAAEAAEAAAEAAAAEAAGTATAAAPAAAEAELEAVSVDVAKVAAELIRADAKGLALRREAQEALGRTPVTKAAGPIMAAIVKHASASGQLTLKAPWISKEQYGHLLKWLCYESVPASVDALIELQLMANELNFPKGLLAGSFMKLYEEEVLDEPAYWAWKDDRRDTAGKSKALIDSVKFFQWLQEAAADDDEEEEDSEVEEALKGVVRPNNSNKLR